MITTVIVENIHYDPAGKRMSRHAYEVPEDCEPEISKRKTPVSRGYSGKSLGKTYRLPKNQYLATLFLQNELQACLGKASDKYGILRSLRREFAGKGGFKHYNDKFWEFARKFNDGILFADQQRPALYAFPYNENGYIYHLRYQSQMLTFHQCKNILQRDQFLDPRFFSAKEINAIRESLERGEEEFIDWNVPSEAEILKIEKYIKKPIYRSIPFASGYEA